MTAPRTDAIPAIQINETFKIAVMAIAKFDLEYKRIGGDSYKAFFQTLKLFITALSKPETSLKTTIGLIDNIHRKLKNDTLKAAYENAAKKFFELPLIKSNEKNKGEQTPVFLAYLDFLQSIFKKIADGTLVFDTPENKSTEDATERTQSSYLRDMHELNDNNLLSKFSQLYHNFKSIQFVLNPHAKAIRDELPIDDKDFLTKLTGQYNFIVNQLSVVDTKISLEQKETHSDEVTRNKETLTTAKIRLLRINIQLFRCLANHPNFMLEDINNDLPETAEHYLRVREFFSLIAAYDPEYNLYNYRDLDNPFVSTKGEAYNPSDMTVAKSASLLEKVHKHMEFLDQTDKSYMSKRDATNMRFTMKMMHEKVLPLLIDILSDLGYQSGDVIKHVDVYSFLIRAHSYLYATTLPRLKGMSDGAFADSAGDIKNMMHNFIEFKSGLSENKMSLPKKTRELIDTIIKIMMNTPPRMIKEHEEQCSEKEVHNPSYALIKQIGDHLLNDYLFNKKKGTIPALEDALDSLNLFSRLNAVTQAFYYDNADLRIVLKPLLQRAFPDHFSQSTKKSSDSKSESKGIVLQKPISLFDVTCHYYNILNEELVKLYQKKNQPVPKPDMSEHKEPDFIAEWSNEIKQDHEALQKENNRYKENLKKKRTQRATKRYNKNKTETETKDTKETKEDLVTTSKQYEIYISANQFYKSREFVKAEDTYNEAIKLAESVEDHATVAMSIVELAECQIAQASQAVIDATNLSLGNDDQFIEKLQLAKTTYEKAYQTAERALDYTTTCLTKDETTDSDKVKTIWHLTSAIQTVLNNAYNHTEKAKSFLNNRYKDAEQELARLTIEREEKKVSMGAGWFLGRKKTINPKTVKMKQYAAMKIKLKVASNEMTKINNTILSPALEHYYQLLPDNATSNNNSQKYIDFVERAKTVAQERQSQAISEPKTGSPQVSIPGLGLVTVFKRGDELPTQGITPGDGKAAQPKKP